MTEPNLRALTARQFARGLRADQERARARSRALDIALEAAIVALTAWSLWLITSGAPAAARWGFVVGLASQPFWIAGTWRARRWGMFVVAVAMCGMWLRGIVNHFF